MGSTVLLCLCYLNCDDVGSIMDVYSNNGSHSLPGRYHGHILRTDCSSGFLFHKNVNTPLSPIISSAKISIMVASIILFRIWCPRFSNVPLVPRVTIGLHIYYTKLLDIIRLSICMRLGRLIRRAMMATCR